jgi:hypothetical protein
MDSIKPLHYIKCISLTHTQDAKKDEACRKAYKFLASLHETCGALVAAVEATGSTMRDIRSLEDQVVFRTPPPYAAIMRLLVVF